MFEIGFERTCVFGLFRINPSPLALPHSLLEFSQVEAAIFPFVASLPMGFPQLVLSCVLVPIRECLLPFAIF